MGLGIEDTVANSFGSISQCLIIYCIEISKTPFKTSLLSQRSFILDQEKKSDEEAADMSVSRRASLERAEQQAAAAQKPEEPKWNPMNWSFPKKAKNHVVEAQPTPLEEEENLEFMRATPPVPDMPDVLPRPVVSQLTTAPLVCPVTGRKMSSAGGPPPMPEIPAPLADPQAAYPVPVPQFCPYTGRRLNPIAPPVPFSPRTFSTTAPFAASEPAVPRPVAEHRLTGPPPKATTPRPSSIKRKPVPKSTPSTPSLISIPSLPATFDRPRIPEPQTPRTPIDAVKDANRALSQFLEAPPFRSRSASISSDSSESSSYSSSSNTEKEAPPSAIGGPVSKFSLISHSTSSSRTSVSTGPPNHGPPPISLAMVTGIMRRRSSEMFRDSDLLQRGSTIESVRDSTIAQDSNRWSTDPNRPMRRRPGHYRGYSAWATNPFDQIDELDTPVDDQDVPPPRFSRHFPSSSDSDLLPERPRTAGHASSSSDPQLRLDGIIVHEPDAMGNSRTARRLRRQRLAAANPGGPPRRSVSNFSRPLRGASPSGPAGTGADSQQQRSSVVGTTAAAAADAARRRGHRRSYSEHDARGMLVRRGSAAAPPSSSRGSVSTASTSAHARKGSGAAAVAAARASTSMSNASMQARKGSVASTVPATVEEEHKGEGWRKGQGRGQPVRVEVLRARRTSRPISPMTLLQLQQARSPGGA
jgi:hypothetical protein